MPNHSEDSKQEKVHSQFYFLLINRRNILSLKVKQIVLYLTKKVFASDNVSMRDNESVKTKENINKSNVKIKISAQLTRPTEQTI